MTESSSPDLASGRARRGASTEPRARLAAALGALSTPIVRPVDAPAAPEKNGDDVDNEDTGDGAHRRGRGWRSRLRYLTRAEATVLERFAEVILVAPEGKQVPVSAAQVARNIDAYLGAIARTRMRVQIRLGLFALNWWPLVHLKLPFRFMSLGARRRFVAHFPRNRGFAMRKLTRLKSLVVLAYYTDPKSDAHTGFEPFPQWYDKADATHEAVVAMEAELAELVIAAEKPAGSTA